MPAPIEFIMIGGFLGAGKTTLISKLAKSYQAAGKHVCVVTNDQAAGLVDTEMLKSQGLEVNEVAGSCFCCNFNGLTDAMQEFETRRRPDIILAEPVGSCTDLVATIAVPLMQQLGEEFLHRPYAVVLKPNHGNKILSGVGGGFSEKAEYIFRKQLEEADIVLINRVDELSADKLQQLKDHLATQYPGKQVICISAKTGQNMDALVQALQAQSFPRQQMMDVDYDVYADGEAELGWLNATAVFRSTEGIPADDIAVGLVDHLRSSLRQISAEPGHLKVLARAGDDIAVANLIDSDSPTVLSLSTQTTSPEVAAIINARVRMAPEVLSEHVQAAIQAMAKSYQATTEITQMESFRPGRPVPTYRSTSS
ncbi:putative GTP-binding protein YjiA [Rubripirellula lacrimiformis]|uniref:Putative GTP-binding protein YjiA n=1 Tax=Rubripirellula lacrimiformis TaxID=1930273 RepID=A0A517NE81_9BACT|nr:CobW-like GTP-binding protein [Rubripirellula lacrimiformis]QDT05439.1 putative GTP-binding protein YjiA [Rubripirellula lacrimiformis]